MAAAAVATAAAISVAATVGAGAGATTEVAAQQTMGDNMSDVPQARTAPSVLMIVVQFNLEGPSETEAGICRTSTRLDGCSR